MKRSFDVLGRQNVWTEPGENNPSDLGYNTNLPSIDADRFYVQNDKLYDLLDDTFGTSDAHPDQTRTPFSSQNAPPTEYQGDEYARSGIDSQDCMIPHDSELVTGITLNGTQDFKICNGMLYRVNIKLLGDMSLVETYLSNPEIPQLRTHFLFDVARSEDGHIFVYMSDGRHLAEVNKKEAEALSSLLQAKIVTLQALVDRRSLQSTIQSATTFKHATLAVNINVYSADETKIKAELDIGSHLSDHKLWLQRPAWRTPGTFYRNPHYLEIGNVLTDLHISGETNGSRHDDNNLQSSVNDIFSMLTRDSNLDHHLGNTSLHTSLLPHQETALYFMTQREMGPIPAEYRSWELAPQGDSKRYRHKIATRVKETVQPDERGAGILADEMGMGKTFSTLALIVTSLDRARKWSLDEQSRLDGDLPSSITLTHGTLIVVPSPLLLRTWTGEIENRILAPLKVLVYHGEKRERDIQTLVKYDIVVTTYHTLVSNHNHGNKEIKDIAWYRIVLDEAHFVRRPSSALFKRVDEIHAKFRWCLTGTPIQNHLEDVGALFKFLRIYPFDRLGIFRQYISEPFKAGGSDRLRSRKALAGLLDFFCLRRTKDVLDLDLDHFSQEIRHVDMSKEEHQLYATVSSDMFRSMENNVNQAEAQSKLGMFHVQLQLRLLCNHGTFQHRFHWHRENISGDLKHGDIQEDFGTLVSSGHEISCSICPNLLTSSQKEAVLQYRTCNHVLCSSCQPEIETSCSLCEAASARHSRKQKLIKPEALEQENETAQYFRPDGVSSKMEQLVKDLKSVNPNDKSIVFSQWTTTLDLVARYLRAHAISFERVDGMYEFRRRQKILDQFKTDRNLPVLIMTLGVGANGLDLTVANRVFMLEPQWNPSVELQAIGRTLRIGQEKPVTVIRYITRGSVEEVITKAQKRKIGMAAVSGSRLEEFSASNMDHKS